MNNELTHHGILGMKWGVRRYQNKDGSLTAQGKKRYLSNVDYQQKRRDDKRKAAVKRYSKASDKWSETQDKLDAESRRIDDLYKKTGKNAISRIFNNAKYTLTGSSKYEKEVKAYSKASDNWSTKQDQNDAYGRYVDELYLKTGKNYFDRIINNIKYR